MGVQGLWQIFEPAAIPVSLESLEGKRIAVDISIWLHQAAEGFNAYGADSRSPHLVLLINRIAKLLFYKIRPVFVFDGHQIPVFKRHLLRDRQLSRYTDQLKVSKQQKRALLEAATGAENPTEALKKRARIEDSNDLFVLPEEMPELPEKSTKTSSNFADDKFLADYHTLLSRDEKIAFLSDAKQKVKKSRLNDRDIPTDPMDFYKFQKERMLQRNQIDNEIDALRSQKAHQSANLQDGRIKMVVVDAHARSHLLTRDQDSDIEIISPEKKKPPPKVAWTDFVTQVRHNLINKGNKPGLSKPSATTKSGLPINKPINEHLDDEDDDDFAETFRAVEEEVSRKRRHADDNVVEVGHIPSKTGAIDAFVGRMNALKKRGQNFASEKNASDDSDFEDVPLSAPKIASSRNLTLNQMTKNVSTDSGEILIDSEDEDNVTFAGRKTAAEDMYDREDEKGVYGECQQLLALLGLPYMVAPGEAEAQCAELEKLGLVEGIVTDDSDIWLFGGKHVYKNMFSKKRNVHFYLADEMHRQFAISRLECILLTMLAGGDYTRGFDGVGMVTALEILAEFAPKQKKITDENEAFRVLEAIRKWLDSKKEYEAKPAHSKPKNFIESAARIRLRRAIEKNNEDEKIEAFPNRDVFEAYCHPVVNSNDAAFKWKGPAFTELEEFLWSTIGWTLDELHRKTHNAFNIWNEFISQSVQSYQTRITGFAQKLQKSSDEQQLAPTQRVQKALNKLFKTKGLMPDDVEKEPIAKKKPACLPPLPPRPLPQPTQNDDDFYDETLDNEVLRLLEEKKKHELDASALITPSKRPPVIETVPTPKEPTPAKLEFQRSLERLKKAATVPLKHKKMKKPPVFNPSELNLSEDEASDD